MLRGQPRQDYKHAYESITMRVFGSNVQPTNTFDQRVDRYLVKIVQNIADHMIFMLNKLMLTILNASTDDYSVNNYLGFTSNNCLESTSTQALFNLFLAGFSTSHFSYRFELPSLATEVCAETIEQVLDRRWNTVTKLGLGIHQT